MTNLVEKRRLEIVESIKGHKESIKDLEKSLAKVEAVLAQSGVGRFYVEVDRGHNRYVVKVEKVSLKEGLVDHISLKAWPYDGTTSFDYRGCSVETTRKLVVRDTYSLEELENKYGREPFFIRWKETINRERAQRAYDAALKTPIKEDEV